MLVLGGEVTPRVIIFGTCPFTKTTRTRAIFTGSVLVQQHRKKKKIRALQITEYSDRVVWGIVQDTFTH